MLNGYICVCGLGVKFILAKRFSCRLVSLVNRLDFKKYTLKYYNPTTLLIFSWIMLLCYGMFYVQLGFSNIFASINLMSFIRNFWTKFWREFYIFVFIYMLPCIWSKNGSSIELFILIAFPKRKFHSMLTNAAHVEHDIYGF